MSRRLFNLSYPQLILLAILTVSIQACFSNQGFGQRYSQQLQSSSSYGNWLSEAIPQDMRTHDFGTVARAAKTIHRFYITNPLDKPIHLRSIRASCGCTTPFIETEWIKPGEQGSILARFNTDTFTGNRKATLTVSIDQPTYTELQLQVRGYIRSDVVIHPGELLFGQVPEGEGKTIQVSVDYAGRSDWSITDVKSDLAFVEAEFEELSRAAGRVRYQITAHLTEEAPLGFVQNQLILQTDDRRLTSVPLPLTADIQPSIQIRPQELTLGGLPAGKSVQQRLVVKGRKPFRILEITSDQADIEFSASEEARVAHVMNIQLTPTSKAEGEVTGQVSITTDLADTPLQLELSYSLESAVSEED